MKERERKPIGRLPTLVMTTLVFSMIEIGADASELAEAEFFESRVRPILVERCYECHSRSANSVKGSLYLDRASDLQKGGDTGPAIVPGNPDSSLLIQAIRRTGVYEMPPDSRLPAEEVKVLEDWVARGATWPSEDHAPQGVDSRGSQFDLKSRVRSHWAWRPPEWSPIPQVVDREWPNHAVDSRVLASIERQGLRPGGFASPRSWIRRLSYDLTGLPPSPDDVQSLEASPTPRTMELLVDRWLASPQFGEKWARHWLDLVRYAETRGHEFDFQAPNAFEYRDYVVRALNEDLPFDAFVREHIAGDLIKNPRLNLTDGSNESVLGTGFWFLGEWVHSPVDPRKDEADRIDNMIDVFGKTFLGLTIACARCHDHKFDAISTNDYYSISNFLRNAGYQLEKIEPHVERKRALESLQNSLQEHSPKLCRAIANRFRNLPIARWEEFATKANDDQPTRESLLRLRQPTAELPQGATVIVDFSKPNAPWLTNGLAFGNAPRPISAFYAPGKNSSSRVLIADKTAAANDLRVPKSALSSSAELDPGKLGIDRFTGAIRSPSFKLTAGSLHYLVRGAGTAYVAIDSHSVVLGPLHNEIVLSFETPKDGAFHWVTHHLETYSNESGHIEWIPKEGESLEILCAVESAGSPPSPEPRTNAIDLVELRTQFEKVIDKLDRRGIGQDESLSEDECRLVNWLLTNREWFPVHSSVDEALERAFDGFLSDGQKVTASLAGEVRLAMTMWEGTGRESHVYVRGNPHVSGALVGPRNLEAIRPSFEGSISRLDLAEQLVSSDDPLVARVIVNRIWSKLMGRGIVASVDNFGVMGTAPTDPELLDALAIDFQNEGWSLKKLIRKIVLSRVYSLSTARQSQDIEDLDPNVVTFRRANVRRLEAEMVRDTILSISGRLDETMFGPSIPVYLTAHLQGRGKPAHSGPLDGAGRRSLYQSVRRNFPIPLMQSFDAPTPLGPVGVRNLSNVPSQALLLLNDPFIAAESKRLAQRVIAEVADPSSMDASNRLRTIRLFWLALSRAPTAEEQMECLEFVAAQAKERSEAGENPDEARLSAWQDLCHAVINSKEFLFLD